MAGGEEPQGEKQQDTGPDKGWGTVWVELGFWEDKAEGEARGLD